MILYYDKQGKPIEFIDYARLFEDTEYRRIGLHESNGVEVSTVWLGLDHRLSGDKPLIFETMVFGGKNDGYQQRYSTLKEAQTGHKKAVKRYL